MSSTFSPTQGNSTPLSTNADDIGSNTSNNTPTTTIEVGSTESTHNGSNAHTDNEYGTGGNANPNNSNIAAYGHDNTDNNNNNKNNMNPQYQQQMDFSIPLNNNSNLASLNNQQPHSPHMVQVQHNNSSPGSPNQYQQHVQHVQGGYVQGQQLGPRGGNVQHGMPHHGGGPSNNAYPPHNPNMPPLPDFPLRSQHVHAHPTPPHHSHHATPPSEYTHTSEYLDLYPSPGGVRSASGTRMPAEWLQTRHGHYNYSQQRPPMGVPILSPEDTHKKCTVVCRHWRRGRCDLGRHCNFAHWDLPGQHLVSGPTPGGYISGQRSSTASRHRSDSRDRQISLGNNNMHNRGGYQGVPVGGISLRNGSNSGNPNSPNNGGMYTNGMQSVGSGSRDGGAVFGGGQQGYRQAYSYHNNGANVQGGDNMGGYNSIIEGNVGQQISQLSPVSPGMNEYQHNNSNNHNNNNNNNNNTSTAPNSSTAVNSQTVGSHGPAEDREGVQGDSTNNEANNGATSSSSTTATGIPSDTPSADVAVTGPTCHASVVGGTGDATAKPVSSNNNNSNNCSAANSTNSSIIVNGPPTQNNSGNADGPKVGPRDPLNWLLAD